MPVIRCRGISSGANQIDLWYCPQLVYKYLVKACGTVFPGRIENDDRILFKAQILMHSIINLLANQYCSHDKKLGNNKLRYG